MHVITKDELNYNKVDYSHRILNGGVFVHPTDTIYGLGCNATKDEGVHRIKELKDRSQDKPFSVIAPSKDWIRENCEVDTEVEKWLQELPGPYTLLLRLKNPAAISSAVNGGRDTLGVRMPNHWISDMVQELRVPLITTSVNREGEDFMTSLDDMDQNIRSHVEFILYEDEKNGYPSTLVNLAGEEIRANARKVLQ